MTSYVYFIFENESPYIKMYNSSEMYIYNMSTGWNWIDTDNIIYDFTLDVNNKNYISMIKWEE